MHLWLTLLLHAPSNHYDFDTVITIITNIAVMPLVLTP